MKRALISMLAAVILSWVPDLAVAEGQGRPHPRYGTIPRGNSPRAWAPVRRAPVPRVYHYPNGFYYQPFYPPPVVISPYGPTYHQPRVVEVTSPYFCVLHGAGFVSRAGMLDHLAGTHKFPLESAAYLCPDGTDACIYPAQ